MNEITSLVLLIITKHFIVDFVLQIKFMWSNKGNVLHLGGYVHAIMHVIFTALCGIHSIPLLAIEFLSHFFIDWFKVNVCKKYDWKCDNSEYYWWITGFDQWLHFVVYVFILTIHFQS